MSSETHSRTPSASSSYQRLKGSPLVIKDKGSSKFKEILKSLFNLEVDPEDDHQLRKIVISPEQVLQIQFYIDEMFKDHEDLKPVSIFKTLEFTDEGDVLAKEFLKWCNNYLTYDDELEIALAQHKLAIHNLALA